MDKQLVRLLRGIDKRITALERTEVPAVPGGAGVGGSGASPRVAYWTAATTIGSDAGLQVDAANDLYIVADGGGIGNSNTTARLLFDSSGATDYAYFSGSYVGINTATPENQLHIASTVFPVTLVERTGVAADIRYLTQRMRATKNANMGDGFGTLFHFAIQDDAGVNNDIVAFGAQRDGADNSGMAIIGTANAGSFGDPDIVVDHLGNVGIGIISSIAAKLHIDQSSSGGAKPVVLLDQADQDYVLMKIIAYAAAASADRTLVADSDFGTPGALVGWIQIEIQDDGNRIADGDYYIPFYAAPT